MKPKRTIAMILAISAVVAARVGQPQPGLTVWLENSQLADPLLLAMAQATTGRIFAQVRVKVGWRFGPPPGEAASPGAENIEIVLDAEAPARFSPESMAYATVGANTAVIHVFYYHVTRFHTRRLAPALLGHVFAHEITHVLENVARHSDFGVLKAHWDRADMNGMDEHPLPFAPADAALILAHFGLAAAPAPAPEPR